MTLKITRATLMGIRVGTLLEIRSFQEASKAIVKVDEIKDTGLICHDAYTSNWKIRYEEVIEVLS